MKELILSCFASSIILFSAGLIFKLIFLKKDISKDAYFDNGLLGVIFISFISLLINFFFPISKLFGNLLFLICIFYFLINFLFFEKKKIKVVKLIFIVSSISFLLIAYSNINRPDAGFYHIPYISILHENKIIIGLSNINQRYGHISIIQYLSAIYNNNFFKLEFFTIPIASIISFYFLYLFNLFNKGHLGLEKKNDFIFLIFIFSIYSLNRYSGIGNDGIAHIFFYLSIIHAYLLLKNFQDKLNLNKIFLFSIFTILNKTMMIIIIILPFYFIIKLRNKIKLFSKVNIFCFLFILLWFFKNLLISGCFLYPISKTCISTLKYVEIENVQNVAIEGEAWAKNVTSNSTNLNYEKFIKNFNWLKDWKNNHFKLIIEKMIPLLIILLFILISKYRIRDKTCSEVININNNFLIIFLSSFIFVLIWFLKFPLYRFGQSFLFIFFISLILIPEIKILKSKEKLLSNIKYFFIIFSVIAFVGKNLIRINDLENKNYFNSPFPKIYTMGHKDQNRMKKFKPIFKNKNIIYYFSDGKACMYSKSPCSNYKLNINLQIWNGYKIYYF